MNALVPLHFDIFDVRAIMLNGEPWWVGTDATAMLGIRDRYQALERLEDYERGRYTIPTPSGDQEMIIINESGMYSLLFTSRKPIAQKFKRWLTTEVLPSLRKHGQFPPPPELDLAILPALQPIEERNPGTRASRFIEELCRVYAIEDLTVLTKAFGIPKRALVWMQSMGTGEEKYLKRLTPIIAIAGCDMRYIEFGVRTFTREERAAIADLRKLSNDARTLAFNQIGVSSRQAALAGPEE